MRNQSSANVPPEAKKRLMDLWDWYWGTIGELDARNNPTINTFGYWFASAVFDANWSLERLEQYVDIVPAPQPNMDIVEHLADTVEVDLARSVRILRKLIEGDNEYWRIYSWQDSALSILLQP